MHNLVEGLKVAESKREEVERVCIHTASFEETGTGTFKTTTEWRAAETMWKLYVQPPDLYMFAGNYGRIRSLQRSMGVA